MSRPTLTASSPRTVGSKLPLRSANRSIDARGRALQPLRPQTINSHLHLLSEILARAVREGLLGRNPAEGEDLRLEVRREKRYGLELDEAMSLVDAAGRLDQRPAPSEELRRRIVGMRASGRAWKTLAAELGIAESTAVYHANRIGDRRMPRYRPVVATLTLGGLRVSELCALNCEHVDLARRELRVLDAKTPAGVRRVDIHDDLQEELAAYKAARGETWQPGEPAFLNARGKRWTRNAIAQHVIPPALKEANRQRARAGLPGHPRGRHTAHLALHLHRVALRRRRRPGIRRRPGRTRRRHDDQPHLPLCAAAAPARRDRAPPPVGDARVCRGR